MVAHDTGSAIVGPARADIFFGAGEEAGARAGAIRHRGAFAVLLPCGRRAVKETAERPRRARLRRLSEEEIALWIEVAKSVARRRGASLPTLAAPRPAADARRRRRRRAPPPAAAKPRRPPGRRRWRRSSAG